MKIKLSKSESYIIDFPEEVEAIEFLGIISRLNELKKLLTVSAPEITSDILLSNKNHRKRGAKRAFWRTRKDAINLLKLHYFGSKDDKEKLAKRWGMNWKDISSQMYNIRIKWNIAPEEIDLKKFPNLQETRYGQMYKLKDYVFTYPEDEQTNN